MNLEFQEEKDLKHNPVKAIACGIAKRLFAREEVVLFNKGMDVKSSEYVVKKQLRCAISSCFDKNNICCKACDIRKCRYKCNFLDKEVCEHQRFY